MRGCVPPPVGPARDTPGREPVGVLNPPCLVIIRVYGRGDAVVHHQEDRPSLGISRITYVGPGRFLHPCICRVSPGRRSPYRNIWFIQKKNPWNGEKLPSQ